MEKVGLTFASSAVLHARSFKTPVQDFQVRPSTAHNDRDDGQTPPRLETVFRRVM